MAIARVNSATGTNSITFASPVANYLQVLFAFRDGSNTAPTVPTPPTGNAWTVAPTAAAGANTCSSVLVYRLVASGSDTGSGTFTNATSVIGAQYSGINLSTPVGNDSDTGAASATVNFNAVTFAGGATGWAAGFVGHRAVDGTITTAPSGMTNVTSVTDATDQAALHDTNGTVSGWSTTSAALGGTSSGYRARVIEIRAAGATYTLTADAGSFGITGNATGLQAARKLSAAAGSFALTGNATGLKAGRKLAADVGSFALTGNAAALKIERKLTADAGSFALTGNEAGLKASRVLTAEAGSFALTGNAADLEYTPGTGPTYTLVAEAGQFTLTGQPATLTHTIYGATVRVGGTGPRTKRKKRREVIEFKPRPVSEPFTPTLQLEAAPDEPLTAERELTARTAYVRQLYEDDQRKQKREKNRKRTISVITLLDQLV